MNATKKLWAAGLGLLALVLPGAALAAGTGGMMGGGNHNNSGNTRNPKYCVVVTQESDGSVKFEAMAIDNNFAKGLREHQKSMDEAFAKACQDWAKAKAEATKAHEKFTDPKPRQPVIRKYTDDKVRSSYATQDLAKQAAEAIQKQIDELKAKRDAAIAEKEAAAVAGGTPKKDAEKDK